jgi:6-phosphogluconolactonase (cycloisomerase 2 family)
MRSRKCVVSLVWSMLAIGAISLAPALQAQFVYVANFNGTVSAYSIGAMGALTPIGAPVASGSLPNAVAVDPTGKFVYVANLNSDDISAYSIGAAGVLTPIGDPVAAGTGPVSVAVDPTGKFVYVPNEGSNDISAYSIGATGALTPIGAEVAAAGSFPNAVVVDPTGKFLYVTNSTNPPSNGNVSAYSIGAAGVLTPIGVTVGPGSTGAIAVDPTGKFVYVVSGGNVLAYSIGAAGELTPIGPPVAAGNGPISLAVDPTGKFVYVANFGGGTISAYSIGATGALTPIGTEVGSPIGITSLAISPIPTPSCQVSQIVTGPPKQLIVAMQDTSSGLQSINLVDSVNASVNVPAFSPGTTSQVLVTATKVDQTQSSDVAFQVTNMAGLTISCDPVDFTLRLDGSTERHVFRSVSPAEHYIRITNGTPGVRQMTFFVNGHSFPVPALQNGETYSLDIGSAMLATLPDSTTAPGIGQRPIPRRNPGQANSVVMYASGQRGSSAYILIGDASVAKAN